MNISSTESTAVIRIAYSNKLALFPRTSILPKFGFIGILERIDPKLFISVSLSNFLKYSS